MHDSASTTCFAEGQLRCNERTLGNGFPPSAGGRLSASSLLHRKPPLENMPPGQ